MSKQMQIGKQKTEFYEKTALLPERAETIKRKRNGAK